MYHFSKPPVVEKVLKLQNWVCHAKDYRKEREREECHKMSINCGSLSLPCLLVGKKEHISRFFTSSARNRMKFIWCKKDRY